MPSVQDLPAYGLHLSMHVNFVLTCCKKTHHYCRSQNIFRGMAMASLAWPLERNHIRRDIQNNAFGMVRNGGKRPHQGWDLYAVPGTRCYAIADGKIIYSRMWGGFGKQVLLEFNYRGRILYAAYCHLSVSAVRENEQVKQGEVIGLTGNTGNAKTMRGEDQHLHFEIREIKDVGTGLAGRIDPAVLYGRAPIGWTYFESWGQKPQKIGLGVKLKGLNVRERVE